MTPEQAAQLVTAFEKAGAAVILAAVCIYVVRTLRDTIRTSAADLKESRDSFLTFLRARDMDEDERAKETRAAFDRNTSALAVNSETNKLAVEVLGQVKGLLDRDDRRHGDRRSPEDHA